MWLGLVIYVGFSIVHMYRDDVLPKVNLHVVTIAGGLLSFMVVFFTGQCYKRFFESFDEARKIGGCIRNIVICLKAGFRPEDAILIEVVRYCNLAQLAMWCIIREEQFQRLGGSAEAERFFTFKSALKIGWCTEEEKDALKKFQCSAGSAEPFVLCLSWAYDLLTEARNNGQCSDTKLHTLSQLVFDLRTAMSNVWSHFQAPIPLVYFHLLNWYCTVYLVVFAYALVFIDTWFCWVSLLMFTISVLGLREVSIMMAEPFGDDDIDINVRAMTIKTFLVCAEVLAAAHPRKSKQSDISELLPKRWLESVRLTRLELLVDGAQAEYIRNIYEDDNEEGSTEYLLGFKHQV